MDSVKSQIETLMKAGYRSPFFSPLFHVSSTDSIRDSEKGRRAGTTHT